MKQLETFLYIAVLGSIGLFGIVLQNAMLDEDIEEESVTERHDPDYYVLNFIATGLDKNGQRRYVLKADRMVHFPDDDTAVFDNPHVIEYEEGLAPRHTKADSGWMNSSGDEILMTGNVIVKAEADERGPGVTLKSNRMRILLDKSKKGELL